MEPFIKQMRVRFSGVGQEKTEESGSVHDRRIPPQKTQSFKENRKTQNWFHRRLSREMSQDYDYNNEMEHAIAVAAAAVAIKTIEESAISDQANTGKETKPSLVRIKSKKEEIPISKPEPGRVSRLFSGAGSSKSTPGPDDRDAEVPISNATTGKIPEKAILHPPSFKKTQTFAEQLNISDSNGIKPESAAPQPPRPPSMKKTPTFNQLNKADSMKPETATPKPDFSTTTQPAGPSNETERQSSPGPGIRKTQADIWEETEIAKLKERYEKQNNTILSWENKKKKKSRHRLDTTESEIEKKRVKALRKFNTEMEYIKQIAEGARRQAEERHRNEIFKVKEKANAIRKTGRVPKTCFCF